MPALTYDPAIYPFTDGDVIDPADLNYMFYNDTTIVDALSILNGGLDIDNFSTGFVVGAEHTQRGSFVESGGVSGTANLDFKYTWFGEYQTPSPWTFDEDLDPAIFLPGACETIYLKWAAHVLVMWEVFWMNGNVSSDDLRSAIILTVDGSAEPGQQRTVARMGTTIATPQGYAKARCWTGHALLTLEQGWHNIGLALIADSQFTMTRVHACSLDYVAFKLPTVVTQ